MAHMGSISVETGGYYGLSPISAPYELSALLIAIPSFTEQYQHSLLLKTKTLLSQTLKYYIK
jgi:hypothetical protein